MIRTTYKILVTEKGIRMYQDGKFVTGGAANVTGEWNRRLGNHIRAMKFGYVDAGLQITIVSFDPSKDVFNNQL